MEADLVRIHHALYQEDIPFWLSLAEDRDPILEVGCGYGRVTLPLLEGGRRVVGVEVDTGALAYLRGALKTLPKETATCAELVEGDILEYSTDLSFGAVIIPCNTLSTFTRAGRNQLFSNTISYLKQEGVLAASLPNPLFAQDLLNDGEITEDEVETSFDHPDTGYPVQVSSRLEAVANTLRWDWIYDELFPDGRVKRTVVSTEHYPVPLETYLDELKEVGFRSTECLGDFSGREYSDTTPYLILCSYK